MLELLEILGMFWIVINIINNINIENIAVKCIKIAITKDQLVVLIVAIKVWGSRISWGGYEIIIFYVTGYGICKYDEVDNANRRVQIPSV